MGQPRVFTAQDILDAIDRAVAGCKAEHKINEVILKTDGMDFVCKIEHVHFTPQGLQVIVRRK